MNLLILGANGGTGRALVEQALELGHVVTAFVRDPNKVKTKHANLRVAQGNILDAVSLESAMQGQDVVLSALGARLQVMAFILVTIACQLVVRFGELSGVLALVVRYGIPLATLFYIQRTNVLSEGTQNIIKAMEKLGVCRFICESSLGVGDSKGQLGFFYDFVLIPLLLRGVFADKAVQEEIIRGSKLEWVIVRPGALTNGPRTGKYHSWTGREDKSIQRKISRADTADFMLKQVSEDTNVGKCPGLSY